MPGSAAGCDWGGQTVSVGTWRKRVELDPKQEVLVGPDGRDLGTVWPSCMGWSWSYRGRSSHERVVGLAETRGRAKAEVRRRVKQAMRGDEANE